MDAKLSSVKKPLAKINPLLPALICFGPVAMWMGFHAPFIYAHLSKPDWFDNGIAMTGTFMLMIGLVMIASRQVALERRLDELERLKN